MDIWAERLQGGFFVVFQQRRSGEADDLGIRADRRHCRMKPPGLRPVAFVHKDRDVPLRLEIISEGCLQILNVVCHILFASPLPAIGAVSELVDKRAKQVAAVRRVQPVSQILAAFRTDDLLLPYADEILLNLVIELLSVRHHKDAGA